MASKGRLDSGDLGFTEEFLMHNHDYLTISMGSSFVTVRSISSNTLRGLISRVEENWPSASVKFIAQTAYGICWIQIEKIGNKNAEIYWTLLWLLIHLWGWEPFSATSPSTLHLRR
jgi:hypothetical protein